MLECEFSGYPKPKIRYLKDNMLVSRFNNSRIFPHLKVREITCTLASITSVMLTETENMGRYFGAAEC